MYAVDAVPKTVEGLMQLPVAAKIAYEMAAIVGVEPHRGIFFCRHPNAFLLVGVQAFRLRVVYLWQMLNVLLAGAQLVYAIGRQHPQVALVVGEGKRWTGNG